MPYKRYHSKCYERCERVMIDRSDLLLTDDENAFAAQYAEIHRKQIEVCGVLEQA